MVRASVALAKAQQVIDLTLPLDPLAWVCHLDGRSVRHMRPGAPDLSRTMHASGRTGSRRLLPRSSRYVPGRVTASRVAVENLEGYPPDFVVPVVARTPGGRCLDVGHLWLDGIDPLPHLDAALPRLRVLHLHGVEPQRKTDHCSLAYADPAQLDAVLGRLLAADYSGVVCLEVFEEEDFHSSLGSVGGGRTPRAWRKDRYLEQAFDPRAWRRTQRQEQLRRSTGRDHSADQGGGVLYVATAEAWDDEMRRRIAAHKAQRPAHWRTVEAPRHPGAAIRAAWDELGGPPNVVLVDCLTLLANNVLITLPEDATEAAATAALMEEVDELLAAWDTCGGEWIVVSNEVGLGIVPAYPLGRLYRDALGRANQRLAAVADTVVFMVAGIPMRVKG